MIHDTYFCLQVCLVSFVIRRILALAPAAADGVFAAYLPDSPPMAAVQGCSYTMFHTMKAENPISIPKDA